jgi:hypothetical protein
MIKRREYPSRQCGLAVLALVGLLTVSCARQSEPDPNAASANVAEQEASIAAAHSPSLSKPLLPHAAIVAADTQVAVLASDAEPPESLYRFFVPIDGWARGAAAGRSAANGGGIVARCEYRRGDNERFVAKLSLGLLGQSVLRTAEAVRKAQTDPALVQRHDIDDVAATLYRDTVTRKNWVLTARLEESQPAVLEMTFVGVAPDECLALARQFDWQGMTQATYAIAPAGPKPGPGLPMDL